MRIDPKRLGIKAQEYIANQVVARERERATTTRSALENSTFELRYIIFGDPRTKKNSPSIVGAGKKCPVCGKPAKQWIVQSKSYREYENLVLQQLTPVPDTPISYPVNCRYVFFMGTKRRVDALNLQAAIDDILVKAGVLADDNVNVVVSHDGSRVLYDKSNPRVEITIHKLKKGE